MNSLYKRIESNAVNYGESFVISNSTDEEMISNLSYQKKALNQEVEKTRHELEELKTSLKDLFVQKDSIIENAKKEAEQIKAKATSKADEILKEANGKKNEIVAQWQEEGRKQGIEIGYNEGLEKFNTEYAEHIKSLNALTKATFEVKNEIIYSAEKEIVNLALLIAHKVAQTNFERNSEVFKNMANAAISMLKEKEQVKIIVNPKTIQYAKEIIPELEQVIDDIENIKIIQDKSITTDGAVVESIDSRIDARISSQMEILARNLFADNENNVLTEEIENKISEKLV